MYMFHTWEDSGGIRLQKRLAEYGISLLVRRATEAAPILPQSFGLVLMLDYVQPHNW